VLGLVAAHILYWSTLPTVVCYVYILYLGDVLFPMRVLYV